MIPVISLAVIMWLIRPHLKRNHQDEKCNTSTHSPPARDVRNTPEYLALLEAANAETLQVDYFPPFLRFALETQV